jgi:NTP pyrophosphatase (non-canonical NTP hydrolase)
MDLSTYQKLAHSTARYPAETGIYYTTLGLVGEAGEIANKVKKIVRDHGGKITPEVVNELKSEIGDVLWYVAELCGVLGLDLAEVATANIEKLQDRARRDMIRGSGDTR